ncbi:hypothetical protein [Pedobacter sp. P26]|uniref:hypothetical protein n=1 Tax=Pedobacter sp. P26 TaxID=3423956 RepID=UPI003D66C172
MSAHQNRLKDIFHGVLPKEGTPEYERIVELHNQRMANNPKIKKELKTNFEKANKTAFIQNINGIDLGMDNEIRHFLREFNSRLLSLGLRSMPLMFNILEAFFIYDKKIMYFELLEEEDYLLSFFDFTNYIVSEAFDGNIESIKDSLEKDVIFNYNVGADINQITFKSQDGAEYVISGVSIVRRENEVTILFQAGEITDTESATKNLPGFDQLNLKKGIKPNDKYKLEAVRLNQDPNLWKSLIICRVDLDSETIDGRYIAKDVGQAFNIITDELSGTLQEGEHFKEENREAYMNHLRDIEKYNPIFELAKMVLHLPTYYTFFEDEILDEVHDTGYKEIARSPLKKKEYNIVDNKFKKHTRILYILNRNNKFSPDRVSVRDENFKIETAGYWKTLTPDEFGTDKKGKQITGKTWVETTTSYFESKTDTLIVSDKKKKVYGGPILDIFMS